MRVYSLSAEEKTEGRARDAISSFIGCGEHNLIKES